MAGPNSTIMRFAAVAAAAALAASCTLHKQDTPALTGPSELSTSLAITVSPDVLYLDGASQSLVTVTARDSNGQPYRNLPLRAQIFFNGGPVDFGTLSARSIVTDSSGRATLVYTAPAAGGDVGVDTGATVQIAITPQESNFDNANTRFASIRLLPTGIIVPPDGLKPAFTSTPATPAEGDGVFFDASTSTSNPSNPIASYSWSFGDGGSASGVTAQHTFNAAGNYVVTLTVADAFGRTAEAQKQVTVVAGTRPTATFTFSPTSPILLNQPLHFNASGSTAPAGRTIVSYSWDFGDGTTQTTSGPFVDKIYTLDRTYKVTLTVTDSTGKVSLPFSTDVHPQ